MKIDFLRNIGIIAHIDAGKTTLSERILFYTQKIHRMGEVHNGTATMDYLPEEQERGITISSACTSCEWEYNKSNYYINIIDTPGHVDFTIEVERSLRVLDGAIGVFCAVSGVEPQSETVWRQSEKFGVPKLAFINKIDRQGADFEATLSAMQTRLNIKTLLLNIPMPSDSSEQNIIIDLLLQKAIIFDEESQGQELSIRDLSKEELEYALAWRLKALEDLADADDIFLEKYLQEDYEINDIKAAIRRVCLSRTLVPVFVGSALKNLGVQPLIDAVCEYLPSPLEVEAPKVFDAENQSREICCNEKESLMAIAFKVLMENGRKLSFIRIYSGTLNEGDTCYNLSNHQEEKISRLYRVHANKREQIELAKAGDIVAVVGFKSINTGDSLAHEKSDFMLEKINEYKPVISLALEPLNADEGKVLDEAIARFLAEDPTLFSSIDEGSGHRILSGMGELHLDVILERIKREYNISPRTGNPQVVKRESISKLAKASGLFERELGADFHHGELSLSLSPRGREGINKIDTSKIEDVLPQAFVEGIRQGIEDSLLSGPVTGYPVQDVDIIVESVNRKEGVSTVVGFTMAANIAMRTALEDAKLIVLEPIMQVEIIVPEDWLGAAISLFNSRSGKVENIEDRSGQKSLQGLAPLSKLFGFATDLRSATQGRAGLSTRFEHFDSI